MVKIYSFYLNFDETDDGHVLVRMSGPGHPYPIVARSVDEGTRDAVKILEQLVKTFVSLERSSSPVNYSIRKTAFGAIEVNFFVDLNAIRDDVILMHRRQIKLLRVLFFIFSIVIALLYLVFVLPLSLVLGFIVGFWSLKSVGVSRIMLKQADHDILPSVREYNLRNAIRERSMAVLSLIVSILCLLVYFL